MQPEPVYTGPNLTSCRSVTSWVLRSPSGRSPRCSPRVGGCSACSPTSLRTCSRTHRRSTATRQAVGWPDASTVHVASSAPLTLIECHERRGKVAMGAMGSVLAKMSGIAVHDGWKPYRSYDVVHAPCNDHHLRELDGVGVVWDQGWANEMIELPVEAKKAVERAHRRGSRRTRCLRVLHSIRVRYGILVARGWAANPLPEV